MQKLQQMAQMLRDSGVERDQVEVMVAAGSQMVAQRLLNDTLNLLSNEEIEQIGQLEEESQRDNLLKEWFAEKSGESYEEAFERHLEAYAQGVIEEAQAHPDSLADFAIA